MSSIRRAVIDIGTNSVKLLVAQIEGGSVFPLLEEGTQTRLGEGFFDHHHLQAEAIYRTAAAAGAYVQKARAWQADWIRVIATSAARDARNQDEFREAVRNASGLEAEIITGDAEADLAFAGVNSDPKLAGRLLLMLDAGGGSTEFILAQGARQHFRRSFPLGTVRLLEWIRGLRLPKENERPNCLDWLSEFVEGHVKPELQPCLQSLKPQLALLVGTGGTPAIMAAMELRLDSFDRQRIEQTTLSLDQVRRQLDSLWRMPLAQRRKVPGLPPDRADVILFGTAIYAVLMESLGFDQVRVSTRGLRFAALLDERCPATLRSKGV
jgi:exopolyphosphatase / guanosine-5'-triphosphate,3'-diphosphate pyrophosphatase